MRAVYYDAFGGAEVLQVGEQPVPKPGPGEILVRVHAASVNPVDWKVRDGMFDGIFPYEFPVIPGWDVAGEVAGFGEGANTESGGFEEGERVFAYCRKPVVHGGTYAEFVTFPAQWAAKVPAKLDFVEASTIPLTGLTVWQSLFEFAELAAGQSILVHAAAGGVGSLAVQMASHMGARVYATASAANTDYVKGLGATRVIDYRSEDIAQVIGSEEPDGLDIVFDTVGGQTLAASYGLIKPGGALPALNDAPDEDICAARDIRAGRIFSEPNGEHLRQIANLIVEGALRPAQIRTFALADAAEAMELSKAGHVRGKLVLVINKP